MDQNARYGEIVKAIINEYAVFKPSYGDVEVETVFDEAGGHYELVYAGWNGHRRIHGSVIHVDVREGKAWIQHDGTEEGIAERLVGRRGSHPITSCWHSGILSIDGSPRSPWPERHPATLFLRIR